MQDALNESIDVARESARRADLRDEADLLCLLRRDGIAEENEGKREARQRVLAEVGHDRGGREAELHFRESQCRGFRNIDEVANNGEAESESEGVALHFCDADQRRNPQGALEFDEARGFVMDRRGIPACALAPCAEDFTARSQAQDPRIRMRFLAVKLRKHCVKHRAGDFVAVLEIVQREVQDIAGPLDHHSDWGIGARGFNRFR